MEKAFIGFLISVIAVGCASLIALFIWIGVMVAAEVAGEHEKYYRCNQGVVESRDTYFGWNLDGWQHIAVGCGERE